MIDDDATRADLPPSSRNKSTFCYRRYHVEVQTPWLIRSNDGTKAAIAVVRDVFKFREAACAIQKISSREEAALVYDSILDAVEFAPVEDFSTDLITWRQGKFASKS